MRFRISGRASDRQVELLRSAMDLAGLRPPSTQARFLNAYAEEGSFGRVHIVDDLGVPSDEPTFSVLFVTFATEEPDQRPPRASRGLSAARVLLRDDPEIETAGYEPLTGGTRACLVLMPEPEPIRRWGLAADAFYLLPLRDLLLAEANWKAPPEWVGSRLDAIWTHVLGCCKRFLGPSSAQRVAAEVGEAVHYVVKGLPPTLPNPIDAIRELVGPYVDLRMNLGNDGRLAWAVLAVARQTDDFSRSMMAFLRCASWDPFSTELIACPGPVPPDAVSQLLPDQYKAVRNLPRSVDLDYMVSRFPQYGALRNTISQMGSDTGWRRREEGWIVPRPAQHLAAELGIYPRHDVPVISGQSGDTQVLAINVLCDELPLRLVQLLRNDPDRGWPAVRLASTIEVWEAEDLADFWASLGGSP